MNQPMPKVVPESEFEAAERRWREALGAPEAAMPLVNRSGIEVKPLYTPRDRPETLDYPRTARVVDGLAHVVRVLATSP